MAQRHCVAAVLNGSVALLGGKDGCRVRLSRRDILRIAGRFNAGKHPARRPSPEGTAEGFGVGSDLPAAPLDSAAQAGLGRPFGSRGHLAANPALKRWAILACPFGTAKLRRFIQTKPCLAARPVDNRSLGGEREICLRKPLRQSY